MKILYFKSLESTQTYLKDLIRLKKIQGNYAVVAEEQTAGIGSRNNSWIGLRGNLFLSFSYLIDDLVDDLPLESASLYFSYLLKETLEDLGSSVWLKWPNDFYIDDLKIGGMITNIVGKNLICGVGLNLKTAPKSFTILDISLEKTLLLENFFLKIEEKFLWKQVFSKYKLEFHKNRSFFTHFKGEKISLNDVILEDDGSIIINGEKVYSLR